MYLMEASPTVDELVVWRRSGTEKESEGFTIGSVEPKNGREKRSLRSVERESIRVSISNTDGLVGERRKPLASTADLPDASRH
jgi:hypothetical protein